MYSICGVQQNSNHSLVRGFCWHLIKLTFENEDMEVQSLNREAVALGLQSTGSALWPCHSYYRSEQLIEKHIGRMKTI